MLLSSLLASQYWSDCRASGDGGGDTAPTAGDTTPTAACAGDWGQCGGAGGGAVGGVWGGPTCCEAGASCTYKDEVSVNIFPTACTIPHMRFSHGDDEGWNSVVLA